MLESYELNPDECVQLLRAGTFGRIAVTTPDGPHIVPMNYAFHDGSVVIRTTPYSQLGSYGPGAQLCFEIDHVNYEYYSGWSVVARGVGEAVTDPAELAKLTSAWGPKPWAAGSRTLYLGMRCDEISGRRLGPKIDWSRDVPTTRMAPST
ncbi:pyridoxamine 5'-phosphate oxidase family protein [Marmoricola sp. RAF53]|uniref:pyridoxamine 5'-phosphate oxidase family protein n=1 Tax=Marmoricola sp. RAF53 TaxID=3233059 RepID=UPI003F95F661